MRVCDDKTSGGVNGIVVVCVKNCDFLFVEAALISRVLFNVLSQLSNLFFSTERHVGFLPGNKTYYCTLESINSLTDQFEKERTRRRCLTVCN